MQALFALALLGAVFAASASSANRTDELNGGHFEKLFALHDEILARQDLLDVITARNETAVDLPEAKIKALDRGWRWRDPEVSKPVYDNALSHFLAERITANGRYAEIVVMDKKGFNVAVSNDTDDYWQGDEPQFLETFALKGNDTYYISPVYFDRFRGIFAQQLAKPISLRGTVIGAISFQVNIQYTGD